MWRRLRGSGRSILSRRSLSSRSAANCGYLGIRCARLCALAHPNNGMPRPDGLEYGQRKLNGTGVREAWETSQCSVRPALVTSSGRRGGPEPKQGAPMGSPAGAHESGRDVKARRRCVWVQRAGWMDHRQGRSLSPVGNACKLRFIGPCKSLFNGSKNPGTERWPSGRRRTPGKCVGGKPSPGFESLSLRHQFPVIT